MLTLFHQLFFNESLIFPRFLFSSDPHKLWQLLHIKSQSIIKIKIKVRGRFIILFVVNVILSESLFETHRKIQKETKTEKVLEKQKSNIIVAQAGVCQL
jgi:hypothetical protein